MDYLPPFVVHGAHTIKNEEIAVYAEKYRKLLQMLSLGEFNQAKLNTTSYFNDLTE